MNQKSTSKESIDLPATKIEVHYSRHKRSNSEISAWEEIDEKPIDFSIRKTFVNKAKVHKKSEYKKVFIPKIEKQSRNEGFECIKQRNFKLPHINKSINFDDSSNKRYEFNEDINKDLDQVKIKHEKSFKASFNADNFDSCAGRHRANSIMEKGNRKGWFYDWKGENCGSVVRINEFHGYSIKVVRKVELGKLNKRFISNIKRSKLDVF